MSRTRRSLAAREADEIDRSGSFTDAALLVGDRNCFCHIDGKPIVARFDGCFTWNSISGVSRGTDYAFTWNSIVRDAKVGFKDCNRCGCNSGIRPACPRVVGRTAKASPESPEKHRESRKTRSSSGIMRPSASFKRAICRSCCRMYPLYLISVSTVSSTPGSWHFTQERRATHAPRSRKTGSPDVVSHCETRGRSRIQRQDERVVSPAQPVEGAFDLLALQQIPSLVGNQPDFTANRGKTLVGIVDTKM